MKKPALKAILSTLLILLLLLLAFTGALLYFGKTGLVLGIPRNSLREVHFYTAILMCVFAAVHLILNCRLYLAGLKTLLKKRRGNVKCPMKTINCKAAQIPLPGGVARSAGVVKKGTGNREMKMRGNIAVYISLAVLFVIVGVLAFLNRGDTDVRRALEENRQFQIRLEGELQAIVNFQDLLDLEPQEFTATYATSISAPRETTLKGVELRLIIESLEIDTSGAGYYVVSGLDAYYSPLTRDEVEKEETVYICYSMDGEILKKQDEGGFGPFLLVIRGESYAQRWCKYVEAVDIRK